MATFTLEQGTAEFKQYFSEQKIDVPFEYVDALPPQEHKSVVSASCWAEHAPPNAQHWHEMKTRACDSVILTLHHHAATIIESGRMCYWTLKYQHNEDGHCWTVTFIRYDPEHPVKQAREALEADAPRIDEPAAAVADQHAGAA